MGTESKNLRDLLAGVITTGGTINVETSTASDLIRAVISTDGLSLKVSGNFGTSGTGGTGTLVATDYLYFGDQTTDGSWRMTIVGTDLIVQRKVSGDWLLKGTFTG